MKTGYSLIETLVVVLIIGILTSVALPQYQKAVRKADLARYMTMVKILRTAEDVYYETYKTYTDDLDLLDIHLPSNITGCSKKTATYGQFYECKGEIRYGIFNNASNAQAGGPSLRYAQVIKDYKDNGVNFKAGENVCFFKGDAMEKVCRTLGPGTKKKGNGWSFWVM